MTRQEAINGEKAVYEDRLKRLAAYFDFKEAGIKVSSIVFDDNGQEYIVHLDSFMTYEIKAKCLRRGGNPAEITLTPD